MKSRVLTIAALSLALPSVAFAASKSTPAGIEKQCETYGYIGESELVDEVVDLGESALERGGLPEDVADLEIDVQGEGLVIVTGVPEDADDGLLVLAHSDGTGGGEAEDLDILGAALASDEGAIFTLVEDGADAILYVDIVDEDGTVTSAKSVWSDGGCNTKGVECTYTAELGRYDGLASDDRILYVPVYSAKNGDDKIPPIKVVKVVKSLTGLG